MYGSYYTANYYENPVPYTHSDIGEPVPGWGVNPVVAGPARVGIGAEPKLMAVSPSFTRLTPVNQGATQGGSGNQDEAGDEPMSPWVWPIAFGVLVGVGTYVVYRQGWL